MFSSKKTFTLDGKTALIGMFVRGKIGSTYDYKYTRKDGSGQPCGRSKIPGTVYRVRRGNGVLGAILGKRYQDKFLGVVPPSISNPEGEPYRQKLKAAVLAWQNLTEAEKQPWRKLSVDDKNRSGYNLFVRDYMRS